MKVEAFLFLTLAALSCCSALFGFDVAYWIIQVRFPLVLRRFVCMMQWFFFDDFDEQSE